jgi:hypothetical protein
VKRTAKKRREPRLLPVVRDLSPHELFVCEPINAARLSRKSCGARHLEAKRRGEKGKVALVTGTCARCAVGAAHAKNRHPMRWPDGTEVRVLKVVPRVSDL